MEKMIFTKEYERGFTLALEEFYARGFLDDIVPRLEVACPHPVFSIFFVTEENMQIWENRDAFAWLKDQFLARNAQGTAYIESIIREYQEVLTRIEAFWDAGPIGDTEALLGYKSLLKRGAPLFCLWYYAGDDPRTPEGVKQLILKVRETDQFFAGNDTFIKKCIEHMGGDPRLGNLIFSDEFPTLPPRELLEARARGVVSVDGRKEFITSLKGFATRHNEFTFEGLFDSVEGINEVKGQIAQKGTVSGRVRIVKNKFQMEAVEEGDILLSPMTTPDFISAMQRAAAFVTDEGGVMCHAAIVARELDKPCVIGTKIGTQVFKDGDTVVVDANSGVVRKV